MKSQFSLYKISSLEFWYYIIKQTKRYQQKITKEAFYTHTKSIKLWTHEWRPIFQFSQSDTQMLNPLISNP